MRRLPVLLLICASILSACGLDTDADYIPDWKATWIVVEDSTSAIQWIRIDSVSVSVSTTNSPPISVDAADDQLWTVNSDGSITSRALESGDIESSYTLPSGEPQSLAIGLDQLYVSGTDSAIHFLDLTSRDWQRLPVDGLPGLIETRSDRGFVVVNDTIVIIVQEQAFSPRDTLFYSIPITALRNDPDIYTFLFHDSAPDFRLSRINYHDQVFQYIERRTDGDGLLINPVKRRIYDQEYLGDLGITEGCLTSLSSICGDQFWPIWEVGMILVVREGILYRHDLFSGEVLQEYGEFEGEITDGENIIN